jgi:endonuclease/exonuclease/phosphatase family metal-dependent hydrolase
MLTVVSWNMNQRLQAWQRLRDLTRKSGASIALLQEARRPGTVEDDWRIHPPVDDTQRWRIAVPRFYLASDGSQRPTRRYWASAVVATGGTTVRFRKPVELCRVVDGGFACSHPGQFAVGVLDLEAGRRLTVISLYGIWDPVPGSRTGYVEASLHRAISDLSVVLQEPEADLILVAGDFNLYDYPVGGALTDRSLTVWSRLAAYGLEICGPFRPGDEPRLARCPCPDSACRHVNTYLNGANPKNRPYQLDYFLATPSLRERLTGCWADPDPDWMTHSDHRAIFATFDL